MSLEPPPFADSPRRDEPFVGDVIYFWVDVLLMILVVIGVLVVFQMSASAQQAVYQGPDQFGGASMAMERHRNISQYMGLICLCTGAVGLVDIWIAANVKLNRAWAFYVSLILALIACLPGRETSSGGSDLLMYKFLGFGIAVARVGYLLLRVSGTIGPKQV